MTRRAAIALVALSAIAAALMPSSAILRYYMFWFICLISLNLYFIASLRKELVQWVAGAVFLVFVLVVVDATDQNFIHPYFHSAEALVAARIDPRILQEVISAGNACLALDRANQPFLYAPVWHPGKTYAVKAGPFFAADRREVEEVCDGWKIIRSTPAGAVDSPGQAPN